MDLGHPSCFGVLEHPRICVSEKLANIPGKVTDVSDNLKISASINAGITVTTFDSNNSQILHIAPETISAKLQLGEYNYKFVKISPCECLAFVYLDNPVGANGVGLVLDIVVQKDCDPQSRIYITSVLPGNLTGAVFSPKGKLLFTFCDRCEYQVVEFNPNPEMNLTRIVCGIASTSAFSSLENPILSFSSDESMMSVSVDEHSAYVYDITTANQTLVAKVYGYNQIPTLKFIPNRTDGAMLLSADNYIYRVSLKDIRFTHPVVPQWQAPWCEVQNHTKDLACILKYCCDFDISQCGNYVFGIYDGTAFVYYIGPKAGIPGHKRKVDLMRRLVFQKKLRADLRNYVHCSGHLTKDNQHMIISAKLPTDDTLTIRKIAISRWHPKNIYTFSQKYRKQILALYMVNNHYRRLAETNTTSDKNLNRLPYLSTELLLMIIEFLFYSKK